LCIALEDPYRTSKLPIPCSSFTLYLVPAPALLPEDQKALNSITPVHQTEEEEEEEEAETKTKRKKKLKKKTTREDDSRSTPLSLVQPLRPTSTPARLA